MKRLCLAVVLASAVPILQVNAVEIVGHRGASFDAPENTLASIRLAWRQNADAAEFDIYLSKDGKIVVSHDDTFLRTGGVNRKVADSTLAEAKAIDVGRWKDERFAGEMVPTLAEKLATVPPGKRVFIEVKCGPEIVPELDRVIKASGLKPEQTCVIAFSSDVIAAVKKARPELQAYWLASLAPKKEKKSPTVEELIATAKTIHADGLNLSATPSVLTPAYAQAIRTAGLKLLVWTVNDADLARQMIALGAESITTDRPAWLRDRLAEEPATLRVMSFNLRYATADDGENRWEKRKEMLFDTVKGFDPDLLGTQETLKIQRDELAKKFPGYAVWAAGRDDGKDAGEMAAVFYRKQRFEKLDGGHFWLSETPSEPGSKGWDAALPRIATWVKLKDRNAPKADPLFFVNVHFDHRGTKARLESAKLLRAKIGELGQGCRIVVTGDFNTGEASEPYKAIFDLAAPVVDAFRTVHPVKGPGEGTFSKFKPEPSNGDRIDWIGCSRDWSVCSAAIDRFTRNGRCPSDHFPVTAVLVPADLARKTLRVLSYNIHHGEGTDKKFDLPRLAKVIADAKPDFVALQEVDRNTKRSGKVDQTAELARLTKLYGRFGKAIDYEGGEYGQAILSRFPIGAPTVHQLPGTPEREQRIAVEARCTLDGQELAFVTTHLHHANAAFREQQAAKLNELFESARHRVVLAGDLNAVPDSKPVEVLAGEWTLTANRPALFTFPAANPAKQIDYVLVRPAGRFRTIEQKVIDEPVASDHRPVLAVLELTSPRP